MASSEPGKASPTLRASRPVTRRPSVIIAGAGIVGATLAYHLASAGASVTIVERSRPASGVTARSFAWINVIRGNAPDIAQLRNLAIADYRRLERELDGALAIDWNGALAWSANPAESERLVVEHAAWGHDVRLVEREEIRRLEPRTRRTATGRGPCPGRGCARPGCRNPDARPRRRGGGRTARRVLRSAGPCHHRRSRLRSRAAERDHQGRHRGARRRHGARKRFVPVSASSFRWNRRRRP